MEQLPAGPVIGNRSRHTSCPVQNVSVTDDASKLLASIDPETLGRRIRQARLKVDITQSQLAGDDASIGYISRIESGKRRPELSLLGAIASRLKTTPLALLTGAPDPSEMRIRVTLDHAELALRGGDPAEATNLLESVRAEVEESPVPELSQRWGLTHALTSEAHGNLDDAIMELEDLLSRETDVTSKTRASIALSRCYREGGDFARAIATGETCLDTLRALDLDGSDDAVQLAVTVAAAHFTQGDIGHAVRLGRRAIERAEEAGSAVARASAYWNASIMESRRGATEAALPLAQKALQLFDSADSNRNLARLRSQLGIFQLRLDPPDVASAQENLDSAAVELEWSGASPVDRGRNNVALAQTKLMTGHPQEALAQAESVLTEVRQLAPLLAAGALTVMGQAELEIGNQQEAIANYREAVGILTGVGSDRTAAESWFELGVLLDEVGLRDEARDAFRSSAASTGMVALHAMRQRESRV